MRYLLLICLLVGCETNTRTSSRPSTSTEVVTVKSLVDRGYTVFNSDLGHNIIAKGQRQGKWYFVAYKRVGNGVLEFDEEETKRWEHEDPEHIGKYRIDGKCENCGRDSDIWIDRGMAASTSQ